MYPGPPSSSSLGQPLQMPLVQSNSEVLLPAILGRMQNADSKSSQLSDSKSSHLSDSKSSHLSDSNTSI